MVRVEGREEAKVAEAAASLAVRDVSNVLRNLCSLSQDHNQCTRGPGLHHRSSYLIQSRRRRRTHRCISSQGGVVADGGEAKVEVGMELVEVAKALVVVVMVEEGSAADS